MEKWNIIPETVGQSGNAPCPAATKGQVTEVEGETRVVDQLIETDPTPRGKEQGGKGNKSALKSQQKGKRVEKGKGVGKKSKQNPSKTQSKDPVKDLDDKIRQPVDIHALAARYGLDYEKILKQSNEDEEGIGADKKGQREARRNAQVLKTIQKYFQTSRAAMKIQGNRVHLVLYRLPGSLLTIAEKRCESLSSTGHRLAHNYTRLLGHPIYRCPVPGCGGATINSSSIARSTPVHFRAFHRDLSAIFIIRIELRNGWDCIQVPEQEIGWQKDRSAEEEKQSTQEEKDQTQERTCATMQPYKGKTSVQIDKRVKEAQRQKDEGCPVEGHQKLHSGIVNRDPIQRMSAEAMSSKGVFRIAPGPGGSGLQEVTEPSKGKGKQKAAKDETMTKEKFEQQILNVSGYTRVKATRQAWKAVQEAKLRKNVYQAQKGESRKSAHKGSSKRENCQQRPTLQSYVDQ